MELKTGQYVRHRKYGRGTILEYNPHQTLVIFRGIGIKRLQTAPTNFAAVSSEAPKKKTRV
ncbi:MAG TPA: hypothetical protein VIX19_10290 [Terriglobales bacterium]